MQNVLTARSNVLVTGATGLIGGEIVRRLVRRRLGHVSVLVRPSAEKDAVSRFRDRLQRSGDSLEEALASGVEVLTGDVRLPQWGLEPDELARVTSGVDVIIHCAADTSFLCKKSVGETNVAGTRNLIELAGRCRRPPLIAYMSTATNGGDVGGHRCLTEDEGCQPANEHFNDYTRTKAVAESMLRDSGLPVVTLRPTIVFSAGVPDPEFAQQILWFVPLLRAFDGVPLDADARLDLVPVSYVADATIDLLCRPVRKYDCYHLSAGRECCTTIRELNVFVNGFYRRRRPLRLVPPAHWDRAAYRAHVATRRQKKIFFAMRYYLPFLNMDVVYDNGRLTEELGDVSGRITPMVDYLGSLLKLIRGRHALREAARP